MSISTAKLREEECALKKQMLTVLEESEGRSLSPEEEERFDQIAADQEALARKIERAEKYEALAKPVETVQVADPPTPEVRRFPGERVVSKERIDMGDCIRGWLLAPNGKASERQLHQMNLAGINPRCTQIDFTFDRRGLEAPRSYHEARRRLEERVYEKRADLPQDTNTDGTLGGHTVPDDMMAAIEIAMLAFGTMRATSTIINSSFGGPLPIPTTNDTAQKGELLAENTQVSTQEVIFGQIVLNAYKYSSKQVLCSVELMQDSSVNMNTFLGRILGERIGRITNDHFTTGTGTDQPNGIVTAAADSGITLTLLGMTWEELIDVEHTVDPAYRNQNAAWMGPDSTLRFFKKIKDGEGRPLWLPSLQQNAPDLFLGYPFQLNQSMAAYGASSKSLLFGDLSKYHIRDVLGFTLLRLTERYADYHQVAFLAFSRHDGDLVDAGTNPVKYAATAAA